MVIIILNPYHFEHFDVSNIGLFVNGESTPRPSFKLDVGNGNLPSRSE